MVRYLTTGIGGVVPLPLLFLNVRVRRGRLSNPRIILRASGHGSRNSASFTLSTAELLSSFCPKFLLRKISAPQKTAVKTSKPNLCPPELIFIEVLDEQAGGGSVGCLSRSGWISWHWQSHS